MSVSGTFTGNTESSSLGPVRGRVTIAANIADGNVVLQYQVDGGAWYDGETYDSSTDMPRNIEANSSVIRYRLKRTSHSSPVFYYMGVD